MSSSNTQSDNDELARIKDFKEGYKAVIENQEGYVESSISLMSSGILGAEERKLLSQKGTEIDNTLRDISKISKVAIRELSDVELENEAKKDYHNMFTGDHEDAKLLFIQFFKAYVILKQYSVNVAGLWTQINYIIKELNFSQNSEFKRQLIDYNVKPGLKNTEIINLFCKRMSRILKIKREPENPRKLDGLAEYSGSITYKLSFVFTPNLDSTLELMFEDSTPDSSQLQESVLEEQTLKSKTGHIDKNDSKKEVYKIDVSGSQAWNQTNDYYFQYDPRAIEREKSIFPNVIYLDTHMGADQNFIKTDLILNFSRKKTFSQNKDVEIEYQNFLNTFFNLVNEISAMNMNIPMDLRQAFLFHLGPVSYYNLTLKFLQEVGTGTIHCKVKGGKMVRKFIPTELVKKTVLNYWIDEVLTFKDFDRNDYTIYKKLSGLVKTMHSQLLEKANEEYNNLPEATKRAKNKQEIYKENASNWIGATNIVIFKRFMQARKK